MSRPRWFPILEITALLFCIPAFVMFSQLMDIKHATPENYSNRSGAHVALWFAAVLALYGTIRLALIHLGMIVALPVLFVVLYVVCGALVVLFGSVF
jgi:hypothetical protein